MNTANGFLIKVLKKSNKNSMVFLTTIAGTNIPIHEPQHAGLAYSKINS